ncbi:MAG: amidohydrolase [Actinobacteria bacterium]|nr:MAG: amidohydrolase [Actinomycetota bacterium]
MDLVLRGATVVDGTGAPSQRADVAIRDGRIAEIGSVTATDATTVDLDGLVLAPGFIDPHTHYDAQVLWDPDITPSSWHGVTSVVVGNCGFGIAPTHPRHRSVIMRTLENVEGMPYAALEAGIRWEFETFPEYLDTIDRTPTRVNVATMIGHTPVRFFVMDEDAIERSATSDEVARMCSIVDEALDAGAIGLSTSRSPGHVGAYGKPVPSRFADMSEIRALAQVLGDKRQGTIESVYGPDFFVEEMAELSRQIDRPFTWVAIVTQKSNASYAPDLVARVHKSGGRVYPQVSCKPIVVQMQLCDPFPLANVPAFNEILELPSDARAARLAQPEWRKRASVEVRGLWGDILDSAVVAESDVHRTLINGQTMADRAGKNGAPLDAMVDLTLQDPATRFRFKMTNDDEEQIAELLADKSMMIGLSDAGAHTSQLCDANYATHLLARFVRERGDLSIEDAVWRLTGHPALVYGLTDRGLLRRGAMADLVAFDPATVGGGSEARVHDFPGGADRLVAHPTGIEHVWVRGVAVRRDGIDLSGVRPGRLLRKGVG